MAQPSQESSSRTSAEEAAGDPLGAQVDALLDEMDQAVQGLDKQSESLKSGADSKGFEQEAFSDKPPPPASRVANAEPAAKDARPPQPSGGPSLERVQVELDAAIDAALKQSEQAAPPEPAPAKSVAPAPQPAAEKADTTARAPTEIENLDERLADTAGDNLDDNIDALLTASPAPASEPEAPSTPAPAAAQQPSIDAPAPTTTIEAPAAPAAKAAPPPPPEATPSAAPAPAPPKPAAAAPHTPAPPKAPAAPATPAPAQPVAAAPSDTRVEVVVGDEVAAPARSPLLVRACAGVLRIINAPLAIMPPSARDIVGYLSLVTLFNAAGLWILILLRH